MVFIGLTKNGFSAAGQSYNDVARVAETGT
jgi:hypothetical protein